MKIYFELKFIMQGLKYGMRYNLAKVSKDGNELEFVCKSDKYTAEIVKNEPDYCNYLRASIH
jgi:hypothetical protein